MAKSKESWKTLMNQLSRTRTLNPEWILKEPDVAAFGLEEFDLGALYRNYKRFVEKKNEAVKAIEKERPKPVRGTFSWEGYVAILFMLGMVTYQGIAKNPTYLIFGFLAIGSLFWFFLYYFRRKKKMSEFKRLNAELDQKQRLIDGKEFEYEKEYDDLVKYARATYDHEAWDRRKKASFWKEQNSENFSNELISMFKTYGMDAYAEFRRCLSIVYEDGGEYHSLYVTLKERVNRREIEEFVKAAERNSVKPGIVVATRGFEPDALKACEEADIEAWRIEDVIDFEKEIEKEVLKEMKADEKA